MEYTFKTTEAQDAGIALLVAKYNAAQPRASDGSLTGQLTAGEYLFAKVSAVVDGWIEEAKK